MTDKSANSLLKRIFLIGIIILVGIGAYYAYTHITRENRKTEIRNNISSYVTVETNDYQYSNLGGIHNLVISINNNTDYLLENVGIEITYIKANGEVWRNIDHDFPMLPAWQIGTIKVPDTERGTSVMCRIVSVKSSALGLY